jgi:hypothetical protein
LSKPAALASSVQNQEGSYRCQIDEGFPWDLGYGDLHVIWRLNE